MTATYTKAINYVKSFKTCYDMPLNIQDLFDNTSLVRAHLSKDVMFDLICTYGKVDKDVLATAYATAHMTGKNRGIALRAVNALMRNLEFSNEAYEHSLQ